MQLLGSQNDMATIRLDRFSSFAFSLTFRFNAAFAATPVLQSKQISRRVLNPREFRFPVRTFAIYIADCLSNPVAAICRGTANLSSRASKSDAPNW